MVGVLACHASFPLRNTDGSIPFASAKIVNPNGSRI